MAFVVCDRDLFITVHTAVSIRTVRLSPSTAQAFRDDRSIRWSITGGQQGGERIYKMTSRNDFKPVRKYDLKGLPGRRQKRKD